MRIFKRILMYAAMVISIIVMVICIAGIIGAWYYNTPVTDTVLGIVVPATEAVQVAEKVTNEAGRGLQDVSSRVAEAQQALSDIIDEVVEANIAVEALSRIFDTDIRSEVETLRGNVRAVYDTLGLIQETVESINDIPFIDLEVPGAEELGRVLSGMEEVASRADEISNSIQQRKAELIDGAVTEIAEPLAQMNTRLNEVQSSLFELNTILGTSIESLLLVQENAARWIDLISVAITFILIWVFISQVAVFVLCRKLLPGTKDS